jgi:hypothetical protein
MSSFSQFVSSFAQFMVYVCRIDGVRSRHEFKDSKERGGANIIQDGKIDLQHGTGVDGKSHPCLKGHHLKQGSVVCCIYRPTYLIVILYIVQFCINTVYFFPLQVKNNPCESTMNVCFVLGLLTWLRAMT